MPVQVPPLRERKGDIVLLANHFLQMYIKQNVTSVQSISPEAMQLMTDYNWPGNVRELKNFIQRLVVIDLGEVIGPDDIEMNLPSGAPRKAKANDGEEAIAEVGMSLDEVERHLTLKTLDHTNNNKTKTADILQVTARTLRNKMARYREEGLLDEDGEEE